VHWNIEEYEWSSYPSTNDLELLSGWQERGRELSSSSGDYVDSIRDPRGVAECSIGVFVEGRIQVGQRDAPAGASFGDGLNRLGDESRKTFDV
jgi:hypothetical protein